MTDVGVLGLGRLGMPLAFVLAASGYRVKAWDIDPARREVVAGGEMTEERDLQELMAACRHRVELAEPQVMAAACEVVFVVVPTPSREDGSYETLHVERAINELHYHADRGVTALVSTVSPGTCRRLARIADVGGRPLVYAPQLISLHSVVPDLLGASVWIVGAGERHQPAHRVAEILESVAPAPSLIMPYESAELAKMAVNVQVALNITFANQLQRMAYLHPPANVDSITSVLRMAGHNRPGVAGAGFGGPCLPRDGAAFLNAVGAFGHYIDAENAAHLGWVRRVAADHDPVPRSTFAIIGIAYKEGGSYTDASFGLKIEAELDKHGLTRTEPDKADVVVIALPMYGVTLGPFQPGARVVDLWGTHQYLADQPGLDYVAPGRWR